MSMKTQKSIQPFLISHKASILDALKTIDKYSINNSRIIFITDDNGKVIGSVSDGDCRRGFIKGKQLNSPVSEIMRTDFTYIKKGHYDTALIEKIHALGLKYVPELDEDGYFWSLKDFTDGKSFIPVDAVLMAGGRGERLRPLTLETPKPLLKVAGKPIIDYNVDNLMRYGVEHINVTVNYLHEQLEDHFKAPINGQKVQCVCEGKYLGTIGSLEIIKEWYNDTILLMNSDLFTNIDFESFYIHFKKHNADMSVAAVPYNVNVPYGVFELENTRELKGINEKPSYYYYVNAGIYLIKRELLSIIPPNSFFNATDFMEKLIKLEKRIIRFPVTGYWYDIGKPEDFRNVQEFARNINSK